MTKLEQDLELAYALIENRENFDDYYSQFYRMWPFTTINMSGYLQRFNLENKNCVTIQGSSDHIFELFLKKPKKILGIDTNPLTEHYCYLKLSAFAALATPEEYLNFFRWDDYPQFCKNNYNVFDKDVFQEVSKYLIGDSKLFWEDLFQKYDSIKLRTKLFTMDEENNNALYQSLNYLSLENYQYIRNNRDKINFSFMCTDVRTLADQNLEKQDFITLSNLIIYAHTMFKIKPVQEFKCLVERLAQKLNNNGHIVLGYLYDIENEQDYREIYKSAIRDDVFTGSEFSYHYVRRMRDLHRNDESNKHDACLIYTKR